MKAEHTSRMEVTKLVHDHLGPGKALDLGQRILGLKKASIVAKIENEWSRGRRRVTKKRSRKAA